MSKLRGKMIRYVFLSVVLVFFAMLAVLYFAMKVYYNYQADSIIGLIKSNNGNIPDFQEYSENTSLNNFQMELYFDEESEFRTRYFIVTLDSNGQAENTDIAHIAAVSEADAFTLAKEAVESGNTKGYIDNYRYVIFSENTDTVVFLDCSEYISLRKVVLTIVLLISGIFTVLVTLLFAFFSKRIVAPFEENSRRQKQFITDASHELKTPLAIISANAEVLQYKTGSNDWTENIIVQTGRMSGLINDLLTLSKMDELSGDFIIEPVCFDKIICETIKPFEEVLEQKNVTLKTEISENTSLNGNPEQLKQLVSILTENASKYVTDGGTIKISLASTFRQAVFSIYNTANLDNDIDYKHLFERFYRPDSSRSSKTGGHGIGLSIAQKIVIQHGGTISAKKIDNGICFTAVISRNVKAKTGRKK